MKILIICSTSFYNRIKDVELKLIQNGHNVVMPNCYDDPVTNDDNKNMTEKEYKEFFSKMYNMSRNAISEVDAVLVLNYTKIKNGQNHDNYIGASTFLEMYEAFMQGKKIYMMNGYPENMLLDEIKGFDPIILNGDVSKI